MTNYSYLFLTSEELRELTDLKMARAQIRWLKNHFYPFEIGASGKPKVLRSLVIERLKGLHSSVTYQNEPNFDAIR